jgi:hypothetical protein
LATNAKVRNLHTILRNFPTSDLRVEAHTDEEERDEQAPDRLASRTRADRPGRRRDRVTRPGPWTDGGSVAASCGGTAHSTRIGTRPSWSNPASRGGSAGAVASMGTPRPSMMKLEGLSFPEAVARLTGRSAPSGTARPLPEPRPVPSRSRPSQAGRSQGIARGGSPGPRGGSRSPAVDARGFGSPGLPDRPPISSPSKRSGAARLGWTPRVRLPTKDGGTYSKPEGSSSPGSTRTAWRWSSSASPRGSRPRYAEAFRDRPSLYPDRHVIRPGRPLVIVEGDFDALLLGQELGDLAAVVTLGGAHRPTRARHPREHAGRPPMVRRDRRGRRWG